MIEVLGAAARAAARQVALTPTATRNRALYLAADGLERSTDDLIEANRADMATARIEGITGALLDRLQLTEARIAGMSAGLRAVAALPDPLGIVTAGFVRPNGLRMERRRVPLGVVAVIYEARPNVTSDAAGLCLKAGNAAILRGSSYALGSNRAVAAIFRTALTESGLPPDAVQVMEDTTRDGARSLMRAREWIDLLVPRGGPGLLAAIEAEAIVPYVIDGSGNCHIYVDAGADLEMASEITLNAKTSRPGVCNAAEKLLVHRDVAADFLPRIAKLLTEAGVEVRGDGAALGIVPDLVAATETDWPTEYLDLIMAVKIVRSVDEALDHIRRYGSGHTEAIITNDLVAADRFVTNTDSAVVMVNTSTRFTDGEEFGYGAEIGISTQKLHVRGPMGVEALTCERWVVRGEGQTR